MQDSLSKADRYRKKAVKYHELAKSASPAFLGDFYRGVAVRYLFMAEDASRLIEGQGDVTSGGSLAAEDGDGRGAAPVEQDFELLALWAGNGLHSERPK